MMEKMFETTNQIYIYIYIIYILLEWMVMIYASPIKYPIKSYKLHITL